MPPQPATSIDIILDEKEIFMLRLCFFRKRVQKRKKNDREGNRKREKGRSGRKCYAEKGERKEKPE